MTRIFTLCLWLLTTLAVNAAERPNIVFILADDLGHAELGCYGQKKIRTPHLDRLATQGMRFTQHYSGAPVCAPSRCVLMTGKHLGHAQIRGNRQNRDAEGNPVEGQHPITADALTIAEVLKSAGYATGAMGKWGLGSVGTTGAPHVQGFDLFFGYNCQGVAHSYFPPHLWRNGEKIPLNAKPIPGKAVQLTGPVRIEDWQGEKYSSPLMVHEAVKFIHAHQSQPFFLYLPFIEPHVAMHPPKELVDSYPEAWDDRPYRGQCGYLPHPRPRAGYAAMITHLDQHVGAVLKTLDDLKLTNKTIVLFSSDNGTTHGSPGDPVFGIGGCDSAFFNSVGDLRGFKGSVHEGGIRVPFIARWPGRITAGSLSNFPCYFADHFPTLCEVAGIKQPDGLDGISLLPTLTGQGSQTPRNPLVWVFPEYGGQVAVRIGDFKVVRTNLKSKPIGEWQVYDLASDWSESRDLAKERGDLIAQAEDILRKETVANPVFPVKVPGVLESQ